MSQENVEIVRQLYEAVARRDDAAVMSLYDAEVDWDDSRLPEVRLTSGSSFGGREAIRARFRAWHEAWDSAEDRCDELIDAGEHVVSVVTRVARGHASGAEVSMPRAGVFTVRGGRIVRAVWFPSREEALRAAGLRG